MSEPIDSLTRLPTKAILSSELAASGNEQWLALVDIDQFIYVNDHYGHLVADAYLRDLAALILDSTDRDIDKVFRTGGDEFVILTTSIELDAYIAKLNNIQHQVVLKQFPYVHPDASRDRLTISITALALTPKQTTSFEELRETMLDRIYREKCKSGINFGAFNVEPRT